MIVMKFGGTSVEDANAIRNVSSIVRRCAERSPVVVVSACAGVTNELLAIARNALQSGRGNSLARVEQLRLRHREMAQELFSVEVLLTVQSQIDAMMEELRDLTKSIAILGELTNRSLDTFASFGEKLSTLLLVHQLMHDGLNAVLVNAQEIVITDDDFTRATPLLDQVKARAERIILPRIEAKQIVVTQGFLGATTDGVPTTIGRGGSDYSAAIIGAALAADEIQIWTDVDGMMSCDPKVVEGARLIPTMSFQEAAELAYFGAKVLHPSTILPAVQRDIPVRVLNSKRPTLPGTMILRRAAGSSAGEVKAIAFKKHITLINIDSTRMLMMHGFLARVFEVFAKFEKSVDVVATSEVSISLTIDDEENLDGILSELRTVAEVGLSRSKAIVCIIGEGVRNSTGVLARVFSTLQRHTIPIDMVSLGASEINVTFVVDEVHVDRVAQVLHEEFCLHE